MQRQQQQHCPLTWMEGKGVEKRASERGKAEKTVFTPRRTPANDANWSRFVIDGLVRLSTVSSRRFNTHKTNLLPHPHFYKPSPLLPHRLTLQTWLWAIHINRTVSSWRHILRMRNIRLAWSRHLALYNRVREVLAMEADENTINWSQFFFELFRWTPLIGVSV